MRGEGNAAGASLFRRRSLHCLRGDIFGMHGMERTKRKGSRAGSRPADGWWPLARHAKRVRARASWNEVRSWPNPQGRLRCVHTTRAPSVWRARRVYIRLFARKKKKKVHTTLPFLKAMPILHITNLYV